MAALASAMRGVVITDAGKAALYQICRWDPLPGEILVRSAAAGVCTTERSIFAGTRPVYPTIGGHELVGIVEWSGDSDHLKPGDVVVVDGTRRCATCRNCRRGQSNHCGEMRKKLPRAGFVVIGGGFAEFTTAIGAQSFPLPPDGDRAAATLIEPLACCLHSVGQSRVRHGDTVVVIGAGTMGLLHLMLCWRHGCSVVVVDKNDERLQQAQRWGAARTINPDIDDTVSMLLDVTDGRGADAVFVTAGDHDAAVQAVAMAGRTARVIFFGSAHPSFQLAVDWNRVHYEEICITGASGYTGQDFAEGVHLFVGRAIDLGGLVAERIPLEELPEELGRQRVRAGRVVVDHGAGQEAGRVM